MAIFAETESKTERVMKIFLSSAEHDKYIIIWLTRGLFLLEKGLFHSYESKNTRAICCIHSTSTSQYQYEIKLSQVETELW